jgi:hypothetical protein
MKTIGVDNIVQIYKGNSLSMHNAIELLIFFPSLYFQCCATHCLEFLPKERGRIAWVKQIMKKEKNIIF